MSDKKKAYRQLVEFDPKRMGDKLHFALRNTCDGFGISKPVAMSSLCEMNRQKENGTYHDGLPPKNISTIVFLETDSKYGCCGAWHMGKVFFDGKRIAKTRIPILGWGEMIGKHRIVEEK